MNNTLELDKLEAYFKFNSAVLGHPNQEIEFRVIAGSPEDTGKPLCSDGIPVVAGYGIGDNYVPGTKTLPAGSN